VFRPPAFFPNNDIKTHPFPAVKFLLLQSDFLTNCVFSFHKFSTKNIVKQTFQKVKFIPFFFLQNSTPASILTASSSVNVDERKYNKSGGVNL